MLAAHELTRINGESYGSLRRHVYGLVMNEHKQSHECEHSAIRARDLMVTRFPDLATRIKEAFRLSPSFRDLCEDYGLVITRQSELSTKQMDEENSADDILKSLKIELEQEMFNYFKSFNK